MKILDTVYVICLKILYALTRRKTAHLDKPERIKAMAIFASHGFGLGNFIQFTPTIKAIKERFRGAQITLFASPERGCAEVLSESPYLQEIIYLPDSKSGIREKIAFAQRFKGKFDCTITQIFNIDSFFAYFIWATGAKYRAGHVSSAGWGSRFDFAFNIKATMKDGQRELYRYLELARAIGVDTNNIDVKPLVWIREEDRNFVSSFLTDSGVEKDERIIAVHMGSGAGQPWKQWPPQNYVELCKLIVKHMGAKIILFGTSTEREACSEVADEIRPRAIVAAGKTSIKQAAALLERCNLLICNDSGLMHMAVAVDIPVIAIYGPTDYKRTAPNYYDKFVIIRKDVACSPCYEFNLVDRDQRSYTAANCPHHKCLKSITAEEVFQEAKKLLLSS